MARRGKQEAEEPVLDPRPAIEIFGLKPVIDAVGIQPVIDEVGLKRILGEVDLNVVIDKLGMDWLLAQLTPEQRRELQQRLQGNGE